MMEDSVVVVQFEEPSKAYEAMSELRRLSGAGEFEVRSAALVERTREGDIQMPESADDEAGTFVLSGTLIGLLAGALAGPLGMAIGGSVGAIGGAAGEGVHSGYQEVALETIAQRLQPGNPALVADITEVSHDVLDGAMGALGGTVVRRPSSDVYAEVRAAEKAADKADVDAFRARLADHRADSKAKWEQFKADAKDKLS
jgi:uncharacterized membrane protein